MERVFNLLRSLGHLLLPMFFPPPTHRGLWGVLHALLVVGITIALRLAQDHWQLTRMLGRGPELVRANWLPILFLLGYSLLWFASWLWSFFHVAAEPVEFPDLEMAWEEALSVLDKAGIGLGDTPIYLVVGRLRGAEASLFSGGPALLVNGPLASRSPIQIYAHREAIYVTCPEACLTAKQAELLEGETTGSAGAWGASPSLDDVEKSIGMSMASGGVLVDVQAIIRRAQEEKRSLTPAEHEQIRRLAGMEKPQDRSPVRSSHHSILKRTEEADRLSARLAYLCRLIARSRWPLCPINGVALLATMNATDTDEDAQQFALAMQRDLRTIRESCRLYFPVFALIGDWDRLTGFGEFVNQFPTEKSRQRLGKGYPLVPSIPPDNVVQSIEQSVRWITDSLLPFWVTRMFRIEALPTQFHAVLESNGLLFRFLDDLRERSARTARMVASGVVVDLEAPPLFGGCYIVGSEMNHERAFSPGFWKRLDETQGNVAWTEAAFDADARDRRRTIFGYALLGSAVVLVAGFAVFVWSRQN